jgi:hypothetical protein
MDTLRLIFVMLTIGYSVAWFAVYRLMRIDHPAPTKYHPTPIETTTPEERARGERSIEMGRGRQFGVTRAGFLGFVTFGYVALALTFAIALIVLRSSTS